MTGMSDLRDRVGRAVSPAGKRALRAAARAFASATSGARVLPDFVIIGAQRGGTTSLYHFLTRHPQVRGAVMDKEVHFFDLRFAEGLARYRGAFPTRLTVERIRRRTDAPVAVGEASPYYLFHPAVPARIATSLPEVKLVAMLRDPVERAWSHYRHEHDLGHEPLSFEEALDAEEARLAGQQERLCADPSAASFAHQHHSYVARGRYAEQLERWFAAFPRERLLLVRSEDFYAEPAPVFRQVTDHLGLTPWQPGGFRPYNAATSTGMRRDTRERLRDEFLPWNERLAALTGRDWGWDG